MALLVHKGSFVGNASTSQSITAPGFTPKALMIWCSTPNPSTDAVAAHAQLCVGFGTRRDGSTQSRGYAIGYRDNVSTSGAMRMWTDGLLNFSDSTVPTINKMTLTSFDANGFTIASATSISAKTYHYIVWGGDDLTDANVVEDDWPTSGATFTVVGAGFQPDAMILLTGALNTDSGDSTSGANRSWSLGCVTATDAEWSLGETETNGDTMTSAMNNNSVFSQDSSLIYLTPNADTIDGQCNLASFDSDGATFNNANAPANALKIFALCLKGGQWKAGSRGVGTGGTSDQYTFSSPTFTPEGVLLGLSIQTASNTVQAGNDIHSVGAATSTDGSEEGWVGTGVTELINTEANSGMSTTKAIGKLESNLTTMDPTYQADMTTLASGSFTLTWAGTPGTAFLMGYLAFGNNPAQPKALPPALLRHRPHHYVRRPA